jgi:hypothetical protein
VNLTYRPIDTWPGKRTPAEARAWSPFKRRAGDGSWRREDMPLSTTLELLHRELWELGAREAVVMLDLPASAFRLDGQPRADARAPGHPGVVLAFDSKHGPLKYATDLFTTWQANLRAIALALEALRKVDRYGITSRGEQYTGWSQLAGATPHGIAAPMTVDEAAAFIAAAVDGITARDVLEDHGDRELCYKAAAKQLHPDHGGDTAAFQRLQDAKRVLDQARTS